MKQLRLSHRPRRNSQPLAGPSLEDVLAGLGDAGRAKFHVMQAVLRSALSVLFEKFYSVADRENSFRRVVRNLATKFLLEGHDEFDCIEAAGAEIVDEAGIFGHLVGLNAKVLHDDFFDPLANFTHRANLIFPPNKFSFDPVQIVGLESQSAYRTAPTIEVSLNPYR